MRFIDRKRLREKQDLARELRVRSTPEEKILWRHLRRNQLGGFHFRRQHVLAGFIVDFYCPAARLIAELDGNHHREQVEADRQRDTILESMGARVLRFPNRLVDEDLKGVLRSIEKSVTTISLRRVPPSPVGGRGTGG